MTMERWTHDRMLEALDRGDRLPVTGSDEEWEHNAGVLDDLVHEGFVRDRHTKTRNASGAWVITEGLRLTEKGRQRLDGDAHKDQAERLPAGFEARAVVVLVASPGDTVAARDEVEQAILSWNRDRAWTTRVVLLPVRWETSAVPELGNDAQSVINRQLVDRADIVIALFQSRLGAPTSRAESGTAEEIERANGRGARVHVYFSEMPHPPDVDLDELSRLRAFREAMRDDGLLGRYASMDDLQAKVRTALERDLESLVTTEPPPDSGELEASTPKAILRARFESGHGPAADRLIIENVGTAPAENIQISLEPVGKGDVPELLNYLPVDRLLPGTSYSMLLSSSMSSATQWLVKMRWELGGMEFDEVQSMSSF